MHFFRRYIILAGYILSLANAVAVYALNADRHKFLRFFNRQKMSEKPAAKFIDLKQIVIFAAKVFDNFKFCHIYFEYILGFYCTISIFCA